MITRFSLLAVVSGGIIDTVEIKEGLFRPSPPPSRKQKTTYEQVETNLFETLMGIE